MDNRLIYCIHQSQAARTCSLFNYKLASRKLFQHTSDGYGRGCVSFAHFLLYFFGLFHFMFIMKNWDAIYVAFCFTGCLCFVVSFLRQLFIVHNLILHAFILILRVSGLATHFMI